MSQNALIDFLMTTKGSLFISNFTFYIEIYAIMHKRFNLRFGNFKSIFQRTYFLSVETFFSLVDSFVWNGIHILSIFCYYVSTFYHLTFGDKNIWELGLNIWNYCPKIMKVCFQTSKRSLNDWFGLHGCVH